MTAFLAVVGSHTALEPDAVRHALRQAGGRAGRRVASVQHGGDTLGVTSPDFSSRPGVGATESMLASDDRYTAVVDATLYYRADLERRVSHRVTPRAGTRTTAELVLDAYRAFGDECVDFIEGDFAFAVLDRSSRRLFCARDLSGRRPLYYSACSGGLAVASTLGTLAAVLEQRAEPDLGTVGANAAGLFFALDDETSMRGGHSLAGGCSMTWRPGTSPAVRRFWTPVTSVTSDLAFDDAAGMLRDLLRSATAERLGDGAATAVWMSGGRDSTAVFASAMTAASSESARTIFPVSRSHPVGDVEREDDAIDAVAKFWNVSPSWVNSRDIALFDNDEQREPWSTDVFEQPFVQLTQALARVAADRGAVAALDGHGGDFLFQVSRAYLSDLLSRGKLQQLWHDWRTMDHRGEGLRGLVSAGVQPHVVRWSRRLSSSIVRGRVRGPMERVAPPWIPTAFLAQHHVAERCFTRGPDAQPGRDAADRETRFCLTHPFFANVNAAMAGYALQHGVELRSPLLDRRVVDFALTRPRNERNHAGDQKRLLRAAMRGLLPESVLSPRRGKTGTLRTYFAYHMCNEGLARLRAIQHRSLLAENGIVEPRAFAAAIDDFANRRAAYPHMEALFCTLRAEQWLRANVGLAHSRSDVVRRSA